MNQKLRLWDDFCSHHRIAELGVPLFNSSSEGIAQVTPFGSDGRLLLQRSAAMEALVASEASQVIADWKAGTENLEGLIYMMFWLDAGLVQPLYIGKAEKYGKDGKALSVNIADVVRADGSVGQRARFCRWGDGYAYHIGDLSAVACPGHRAEKRSPKYVGWASNIFVEVPSATPRLRKPTYFWTKAWPRGSVGPWKDVGSTSLTFLEYLLIGLASETFACLLNAEGVNRRSRKPVTAA